MPISHQPSLVLLSIAIAVVAAWAMLEMAGRVAQAATPRDARPWIVLGALVMGLGIWAMHFVAMLAIELPIRLSYDPWKTALSVLPAVGSAALSLRFARARQLGWARLVGTSVIMGSGVTAMHYLGMHAIQVTPAVTHDPAWTVASFAVACLVSAVANVLAFVLPQRMGNATGLRLLAACVMGLGVAAMHHTGMGGAVFAADAVCLSGGTSVDELWLAQTVAMAVVSLAGIGAVAAVGDARLAAQRQRRIEELELAYRTLDTRARAIADQMTAELADSEARYERALRASNDGIYDWDLVTDEVHYSAGWMAMLGWFPDDLPPGVEAWRTLLHPDDVQAAEERLRASLDNPALPYEAEFRMRHRDGGWRWMHARGAVQCDARGRAVRLSGSQRDITAAKLAQTQLHQALEQERELSALRARLVAMASHEFRTPLTVIRSSAGLLRRTLARSEQVPERERLLAWCARIDGATAQMVAMMETVLQTGRAANRGLKLQPVTLSLRDLCDGVLADAAVLATPRSQQVTADVTDTELRADPVILRQVLSNLLSNALKFSPDGAGVQLRAWTEGELLRMVVSDRGIGIPAESMPHLFESFHRAANAAELPGTGLGLPLVKRLVEACGGTLAVRSRVGEGTTVEVHLPRRLPDARDPTTARDEAALPA